MAETPNVQRFVTKAEELKKNGRYWGAHAHYQKAIELLKAAGDNEMNFLKKKQNYDDIALYFDYIQRLDVHFDFNNFKEKGKKIEVISVPRFSLTYNYVDIFEKHCTPEVKEIVIYDNVMCFTHYMECLRNLANLFRERCCNLKLLLLKCRKDKCDEALLNHPQLIENFEKTLEAKGVLFRYEFTQNTFASEHKIVFNTGIVFVFERPFFTFTFGDVPETTVKSTGAGNHVIVWKTDMQIF